MNSELLFDTEQLDEEKKAVIKKLKSGILYLLKKYMVELIHGEALILKENKISVKLIEDYDSKGVCGELQISADKIVIATGSKPIKLDLPGIENPNVITSNEILSSRNINIQNLVIIGGGVIGVEFAMLYNAMGAKVTIVEAMDSLLPEMDKEISQNISAIMKKRGIKIITKFKLNSIEQLPEMGIIPHNIFNYIKEGSFGLQCNLKATDKEKEDFIVGDVVLVAVGRKPNYENLFANNIKINMEGNRISIGGHFETSTKGIYAIGDVVSKIQLAHFASAQATNLAIELSGKIPTIDLNVVPSCVYTSPEIASVGMTLQQAESRGIKAKELKVQMQGNGKSVIEKQERGFMKVVIEEESEKIIGAHIICNRATDMISEFVLAISLGLTRKDLAKIIRPHPTYSESISEVLFQ
jgi:dihydrolipoamide dehydrogenase